MVQERELSEISTLKSGINSQVEFAKQLNLILALCTFILSTILAPLTFYLQQSLKTVDWKHELRIIVAKEQLGIAQDDNEKYDILYQLKEQIDEDAKDYNDGLMVLQNRQNTMLLTIIIPFLLCFTAFLLRYKWLTSLSACIENAYAEKKEYDSIIKSKRKKRPKKTMTGF